MQSGAVDHALAPAVGLIAQFPESPRAAGRSAARLPRRSAHDRRPEERTGVGGGGLLYSQRQTSALSQLKSRVGKVGRIGDSAWHKEVCHAEKVRRATDGSGAGRASVGDQKVEGDGTKGSARSDSSE